MRRAILAAAVVIGCAPKLRTAEDEPISAAWLEYFDLSSIAMLGGAADGDAFLGYTTLDGTSRSLPVHLGGPVVGIVFDMTFDPEWGSSVPLDFTEADVDPVMLSDALGTYHGTGASFVMGAGIDSRVLRNKRGIQLEEDHLAFGAGIMAGFEWIRIREGGSEQGEEITDDTNAPPDDSGSGDDTADDSGSSDDTAIADDSASSDDTGTVADDSGTVDDTGGAADDSGGAQTPPPKRRPKKDGCGSDDDSGGGETSDDDSSGDGGCCCGATNSAFIVGVWLLLGGRRRRRRA